MKLRFLYLLIISFHMHCMEETTPSRMVNNILLGVQKKEVKSAQQWFCRLRLLAVIDWKWLTVKQQEKYVELCCQIMEKIEAISAEKIEEFEHEKDSEEIAWLRNKVKTDNCVGIDWRDFLEMNPEKKEIPSLTILKKSRLDELAHIE